MTPRELTDADVQLMYEIWAGVLFDIIHKVMTERPDWNKDEQGALVYSVIATLAERYGIIDEDDES